GAPEVAVEIGSDSDAGEVPWAEKLSRYRHLGVTELVRFDPTAVDTPELSPSRERRALRIWDRVNGVLVERETAGDSAPSLVLPIAWVVAAAGPLPHTLRVTHDGELVPTGEEAEAHERAAKAAARLAE